ncbi:hypothetical protein ACOMHN_058182 [Nucella lapillus]
MVIPVHSSEARRRWDSIVADQRQKEKTSKGGTLQYALMTPNCHLAGAGDSLGARFASLARTLSRALSDTPQRHATRGAKSANANRHVAPQFRSITEKEKEKRSTGGATEMSL